MANQIQDYLQKDLITELGLQDLPLEKQEQMILRIGALIQQNVILRIINELNEEDKDEFDKVLAAEDGDKTLSFLQSKLPTLDDIVKDEVAKFKQNAIARLQAVMG